MNTDDVRALLLAQQGPAGAAIGAHLLPEMRWTQETFRSQRLRLMRAIYAPIWVALTDRTGRLARLVEPGDDDARAHHSRITEMARSLTPSRLDTIVVVTDDTGGLLVIDGNHRVAAALLRLRQGGEIPALPGVLGRTTARLHWWGVDESQDPGDTTRGMPDREMVEDGRLRPP